MKIYAVGGSVRDELMGMVSKDKDYVVVGGSVQQMLDLGYAQVGADFPVFLNKAGEQFALARTERKLGPGYLGFSTGVVNVSLEEDLSRRDLTINSIAMDMQTGEIIDPFDGIGDIARRVLRHTSAAFAEDPLRVIRLARFCARFPTFSVHPDTYNLARQVVASGALNELPDERHMAEIEKAVTQGPEPWKFFELLDQLGVFSEVNFYQDLFGTFHPSKVQELVNLASMNIIMELAQPTAILISSISTGKQKSKAISNDIRKLCELVTKTLAANRDARSIHDIISRVQGFSACTEIIPKLQLILSLKESTNPTAISAVDIAAAVKAGNSIVARAIPDFSNLQPAEIGSAMAHARIRAIHAALLMMENKYDPSL